MSSGAQTVAGLQWPPVTTIAPNDFTHLHVHSEFSLLDGLGRITELVDTAAQLGMDSMAITDHGALYGAVAFYQAAGRRASSRSSAWRPTSPAGR